MPETPLSEWDKDKTGALVARALVGWGTVGATDGNSGVLRLEYATDPTLKERAAIQLFYLNTASARARGGIDETCRVS